MALHTGGRGPRAAAMDERRDKASGRGQVCRVGRVGGGGGRRAEEKSKQAKVRNSCSPADTTWTRRRWVRAREVCGLEGSEGQRPTAQ